MPVNDGSNISIAGPRGGLTTTDPFQQASRLFSAMRRASGGSGGTNAAVAASLGLPPNAKIDWMLDPQSGDYVPVVGGTDELRKYNLAAAKQRRAIEAINSEKGAGIRAKLEGFGGMSAEKQASILNDIRTNDIPKLSKDAQVDGSDLITYGLADYSRMQKENAANVAKTGTGDILWDSLRIGARNFMDSVADIFSDSNEQLARANLRQQYIRDIQDNNAFLRNRALQQQEGAGFLDRFGWGELAATTGEFLAENAPVLAATALTGGAAGLAARGLGAAAANVGRASMLGSAIGGGLTGAPTQLGSAINEIAADNKLTEDQKLQALDEAYGPSLGAGAALGAVVMPFGQYISRGIGSGLARAGVGNSNVAKMVRSRRAGEALPTGTNNWDEAMAMARRNDILAENEAIANQRFYRGMLGRRLRDSAIEGSLLSGASQMATNAAVGNSLMENVGPATIGGAIGGALFTPFNRRTAMGVPDDVIGQRTAERQKLVDLFAARNAARGGEARSFDDQTIGAMEAWDALAGARGADVLSNATPMTPAQREAYLRQQSYDDLLLNRMMAHEAAVRERDRLAAEAAQRAMYEPRLNARQNLLDDLAILREQRNNAILGQEAADNSILNLVQAWDAAPSSLMDPRTRSYIRRTPELDAEWAANEDVLRQIQGLVPTDTRTSLVNTLAGIRNLRNDAVLRQEAIDNAALDAMQVWDSMPSGLMDPRTRRYVRNTPELDAEWREEAIRRINNSILNQGNLGNRLALPAELPVRADGSPIAMGPYTIPTPQGIALPAGTGRTTAGDAWVGPSLMDAVTSPQEAPTPYTYTRVMNNAERSALQQGREGVARTLGAIRDARQRQDATDDRLLSQLIAEENQRRAFEENRDARTSLVNTLAGGRNVRNDAILRQEAMDDRQLAQLEAEQAQRSLFEQNRAARSGLVNALTGIRDSRDAAENQILDLMQAWDAANPIALDPRYHFYVRSTPDLDAEWAANEAVLRQIQEQVPAETRSSLLGTLRGVRNQRNDDILRQEFRNRGYTRRTPDLDVEWAARTESRDRQAIDRLYESTIGRNARVNDHLAIPEETPRRTDGSPIPAGENPATVEQRTNEARQRVVDTLAALNERRKGTEQIINTAIAQEYYFNRVRDQQFRRDFTIYEGEVLLENNPGVLPTNNYLPENVAAVVENLGEPRIAETMLDGTPATDQRPKPQRPYTKAITYVSSDDALRKFTGKLRGRESMIPRDVREEQMGWMNDILAAGTGKGRISAQGVLAKDVRDTLDKIVDAQTVDSAMRLDELLLTRLRGSEDTSLFNRAQRAAMQYVRNRIYANMDDYAYQNKLGRYGEIDANTPENTDPTGGGGSPTSGMGGTESTGAEPTIDSNLSNDSGRPADTAGVSKTPAGQLPDSTATDSAAVEERGDAGTETPDTREDTTLEGDSAATSAQQQTADGKRDTGNAARINAATNSRTGSDRVEGSSEQGDDRNAADTGSNEQSGSRTEPEDGEPINSTARENLENSWVHSPAWPFKNVSEEMNSRSEQNGVTVNNTKKSITIDALHHTKDNDFDGNHFKIADLYDPFNRLTKNNVPKIEIRVNEDLNAPLDSRIEPVQTFVYKSTDGKKARWQPLNGRVVKGITVQASGKVVVEPRKLRRNHNSPYNRLERVLSIDLLNDGDEIVNSKLVSIFDEDLSLKDKNISTTEQINAHYTDKQREPVSRSLYEIESNPYVKVIGNDETIAEITFPENTVGADIAIGDFDSWSKAHGIYNTSYGRKLMNLNKGFRYETTLKEQERAKSQPWFTFDGENHVFVDLNKMPNSILDRLDRRRRLGIRYVFTISTPDSMGRPMYTQEEGNANFRIAIFDPFAPAADDAFRRPSNNTPAASVDATVAAEQTPTVEPTVAPTVAPTTVEPKGLSSAEEIIERQNNPDIVPTQGVDPESNEALAWAAQQEGNRTHVEDDDIMAVDADTLLRDERREVHVADRGYYGYDGWSTVDYPARIILDNLNGITPEMRRRLNAAERQSYEESAGIRPTQKDIQAAHKVIQENGIIDTRKAFQEDNIQPSPTITAKQSLENHVIKEFEKAKKSLPEGYLEPLPPGPSYSHSILTDRLDKFIDDIDRKYNSNGFPIDRFIKYAASSFTSAKRIIAKRNASDASWREDLRNDMAETAARIGITRSTGLFGTIKPGSSLAKKEEFYIANGVPLIAPNSEMAQHLKEYFGAMPARARKITQAIDYVLRNPVAQKMDIIEHPERSVC